VSEESLPEAQFRVRVFAPLKATGQESRWELEIFHARVVERICRTKSRKQQGRTIPTLRGSHTCYKKKGEGSLGVLEREQGRRLRKSSYPKMFKQSRLLRFVAAPAYCIPRLGQ
jgi:hypothetical protein